jgi:hypothetical protein
MASEKGAKASNNSLRFGVKKEDIGPENTS